jgi:hypothetical protein
MESEKRWWETLEFREAVWYHWLLEGAEIFVCRRGSFWYSQCRERQWKERSAECSGPLEIEEARFPTLEARFPTQPWAFSSVLWDSGSTAALRPGLPAKPFLVQPGLLLFPNMETSLKILLPPLLHLSAVKPSAGQETLFTLVPFTLKESWYGADTMQGTLCLSLPSASGKSGGAAVRCRVLLRNRTKTALKLDTFPLYASELGIYESGGALVSDTPVIDVYGDGDYHMSVKAPEGGSLLIPGNKSGMGDLLIHHGTQIIKNITGLQ